MNPKNMIKNSRPLFFALSLLMFCGLLSSCGREQDKSADGTQAVYGRSSNMRHGGMAEGDGELMYYVWDDGLIRCKTDGSERTLLDGKGGRYLCLTEDTLYYASRDDAGKQGIYSLKKDGEERTLVYEASPRGLYFYEDYLYFLDLSGTQAAAGTAGEEQDRMPAVSRVKPDGSGFERLSEGPYDSFLVAEGSLFARDYETNSYRKLSLEGSPARPEEKGRENQAAEPETEAEKSSEEMLEEMLNGIRTENSAEEQTEAPDIPLPAASDTDPSAFSAEDSFLTWCEEPMPVYEDGWIYFTSGDAHTSYRISPDAARAQKLGHRNDDMLVDGQIKYEGNFMTDLASGESGQWTESQYVRLLGLAGSRLLYEELSYNPENFVKENPSPDQKKLLAYDPASKQSVVLEEASLTGEVSKDKASEAFAALLSGDDALLRSRAEGYLPSLLAARQKECYLFDADGEGRKELFVRLDENGYLFTYTPDGIYCYLSGYADQNGGYEPLSDGTLLYSYRYESGPLSNTAFDLYRFEPGGRAVRENTFQHLVMAVENMELDASADTKVKRDTYYSGEDFVPKEKWDAGVETAVTDKMLSPKDWTALPVTAEKLAALYQ